MQQAPLGGMNVRMQQNIGMQQQNMGMMGSNMGMMGMQQQGAMGAPRMMANPGLMGVQQQQPMQNMMFGQQPMNNVQSGATNDFDTLFG